MQREVARAQAGAGAQDGVGVGVLSDAEHMRWQTSGLVIRIDIQRPDMLVLHRELKRFGLGLGL